MTNVNRKLLYLIIQYLIIISKITPPIKGHELFIVETINVGFLQVPFEMPFQKLPKTGLIVSHLKPTNSFLLYNLPRIVLYYLCLILMYDVEINARVF